MTFEYKSPMARKAKRPPMSPARRRYLFQLHGGVCCRCEEQIDPVRDRWEVGHFIPWEISRDNSEGNLKPEHYDCHRRWTREHDQTLIAKVHRQEDMYFGVKRSANPVPGSKDTPFRKRMNGTVEYRR